MERVMIVGGPGSGKSTLARALGAVTGLPVHHMDHIHWAPGWVQREPEVKDWMVREVHRRPRWIFEGNHSRTSEERVARADTLIWLDLPVGLRLWWVIRRTLRHHGERRPDLPQGCIERFDRGALEFWAYIWRSRNSARRKIADLASAPPAHLAVVHLTSRREVRDWLAAVERGAWQGRPEHGGVSSRATMGAA